MSDGPQAKNYVMQQVYDDATKSIRISGLSGGGGDSLWEYTSNTLEPDPAATTPLDGFQVAPTSFGYITVDDGAGNVGRLWADPAVQIKSSNDVTIQSDINGAGGHNLIVRNYSGGAGGQIQLDGASIDIKASSTAGRILQQASGITQHSATTAIQIRHPEAPSDIEYTGTAIYMTYGASLVPGDIVYFTSSGTVDKADANAAGKFPALGLALETASSGSHLVLLQGIFRHDSLYAWTVGGVLWLSTTAGALTQTQPSATDDCIQPMGFATHADRIFFRPDITWLTHV